MSSMPSIEQGNGVETGNHEAAHIDTWIRPQLELVAKYVKMCTNKIGYFSIVLVSINI